MIKRIVKARSFSAGRAKGGAQELGPLSRTRGPLSGGQVELDPGGDKATAYGKERREKSSGFSLPPTSNCYHSLSLAEPNRKPESKGTWEM